MPTLGAAFECCSKHSVLPLLDKRGRRGAVSFSALPEVLASGRARLKPRPSDCKLLRWMVQETALLWLVHSILREGRAGPQSEVPPASHSQLTVHLTNAPERSLGRGHTENSNVEDDLIKEVSSGLLESLRTLILPSQVASGWPSSCVWPLNEISTQSS